MDVSKIKIIVLSWKNLGAKIDTTIVGIGDRTSTSITVELSFTLYMSSLIVYSRIVTRLLSIYMLIFVWLLWLDC